MPPFPLRLTTFFAAVTVTLASGCSYVSLRSPRPASGFGEKIEGSEERAAPIADTVLAALGGVLALGSLAVAGVIGGSKSAAGGAASIRCVLPPTGCSSTPRTPPPAEARLNEPRSTALAVDRGFRTHVPGG